MKQKILLLSFLFLSLIGYAQPIDWNKKLPADPNVLIGKLPNGITYYLRHNEEPKDRASFFIIRNAAHCLRMTIRTAWPTFWNTWPLTAVRTSRATA